MKSPKPFSANRGFTLIEIMVVLGLVGVIAALSVAVSFNSLGRSSVHTERDTLVSLLWVARTKSLANVDQSAHGVHIEANTFTVFTGDTYSASDPKNRVTPRNTAISISGPSDIKFLQLTGDVAGAGTITLSGVGSTQTIEINDAGRIEW